MIQSILRPMQAYWRTANLAQRALFLSGTLLLASMVVHGIALVATGGSIHGPVSFRKAMTFAETLGLTCWTIGWLLPLFALRRRTTWLFTGFVLLFTLGEAFLMSMQVWRGVPSHYNFTTPFDTAVYYATGVGAVGFTLLALIMLRLPFMAAVTPSIRLAVRAGLIVTLFGSATGILMSVNAGPVWAGFVALAQRYQQLPFGRYIGQAEGIPGGNIVLLHALGVHGLQLLPLVGWLLSYSALSEQRRVQLVAATASSLGALLVLLAVQAFRGLPVLALDPRSGGVLAVAVLAVALCYGAVGWFALRGLRRTPTQATSVQALVGG